MAFTEPRTSTSSDAARDKVGLDGGAIRALVDRAGLDKDKVGKLLKRGLEGADDGELFLEYKQSEVMAFDNGRLKTATYDTNQGFGLRAAGDHESPGDGKGVYGQGQRQGQALSPLSRAFRLLCAGALVDRMSRS